MMDCIGFDENRLSLIGLRVGIHFALYRVGETREDAKSQDKSQKGASSQQPATSANQSNLRSHSVHF